MSAVVSGQSSVVGGQSSVVSGQPSVVSQAVRFEAPGDDGIGRIVIDRPDDSVNAVNPGLVEDLAEAVRAARACGGLRGLIVASGKATQFVAGADLNMVTRSSEPTQLEAVSRRFQAVLDELAWLPCTVVAAINGPALGGGLELALACDYRVGIDAPGVGLGQPEVNLGLVPAGGGTQRLPRLVGLQSALDLILSGRRLNARRARRAGLLDEVVHPMVLAQAARAWAGKPKRPLDRSIQWGLSVRAALDVAELTPAGRRLQYRQARAAILARTHGQYPAPLAALEAVEIGLEKGMAAGFEAESHAFAALAGSSTAKNLIWLFMATQRQKRLLGTLGPPRVDDRIDPIEEPRQTADDRPGAERTAVGETTRQAASDRPGAERTAAGEPLSQTAGDRPGAERTAVGETASQTADDRPGAERTAVGETTSQTADDRPGAERTPAGEAPSQTADEWPGAERTAVGETTRQTAGDRPGAVRTAVGETTRHTAGDRPGAVRTAVGETTRHTAAERPTVERIGVVGAGFMGAAIAEVGAVAGLSVRVRDVQPEAVARGLSSIRKMLDEGVARRRFDAREGQQILQRVSGTTDYSGFSKADLVIEAVFEDLAIKQKVIQELESNLRPDAVIASNTSAIPIKDIARASAHPERIVGMHFFSPAQRMPLLEVIRPDAAAEWALQAAVAVGTRMGKTVIVVGDSPGFYTSRVLGVMMNEAALMLTEGARIEDVDRAMTAFGFAVGPFVLFDEVGLEVAQHAGETVARAFGERVPRASVVPQLVAAGQTGRKAGAGFFLWHTSSSPRPLRGIVRRSSRTVNPDVYRLSGSPARRTFGGQAIQDRLALLFVNEAIRCLAEGVLQSPVDGDLGAVLGLGFPPFRGGPFHYADTLGLTALTDKLGTLAMAHGSRFEPADLLVERARQGRTFFEE